MGKYIFTSFILAASIWVLVAACKLKNTPENIKISQWSPNLTMPFVNSRLNLKNLVENQNVTSDLQEGTDGFYTFIYYTDFDSLQASAMSDFKLPDQSFLPINFTGLLPAKPAGSPAYTTTSTGSLSFLPPKAGQRLDQIDFKGGIINLNFSSTYSHDVTITITIPDLKKNGVSLVVTKTMLSGATNSNTTVLLDGYSLDLTKGGTAGSFNYVMQNSFNYTNSPVYAGSIDVNTSVAQMHFSLIKGYFGAFSYDIPSSGSDTINIKMFDNTIKGNIQIAKPRFEFDVTNSFGIPVGVDLKNKIHVYSKYAPMATFQSPLLNSPIQINSPSAANTEANTLLVFDRDNSGGPNGLPAVFNYTPYQVLVGGTISMNQNQVPANTHNFVTDKSKIKVRGKAIIPMEGRIPSLVFEDTIFLSMRDINVENSYVEYVKFRTNITNGFPLNGTFQMYFLSDDRTKILDSLVSPGDAPILIKSGLLTNGQVTQATPNFYETLITKAKFNRIQNSLSAKIRATLTTTNNGTEDVKIYSNYFIDVKLSGEGKVVYNLN